jgi:hypothetical protein
MTSRVVLCGVLVLGCGGDDTPIPTTCNGSETLCARAYDEVAYATTHNAMSNAEDGFDNPNQRYGLRRQLDDGIRAMMLDVWADEGDVFLCHASCDFGKMPLVDGLRAIDAFLDQNRGEVVTILFESHVPGADVEGPLRDAGLLARTREQAVGATWPTLRELIDADERLIVFTEDGGGAFPWYMDMWAFVWDTPYSFDETADFTCTPNRGDPASSLFLVNHFLTQGFGSAELAAMANPLLAERVAQCMSESGQLPNYVAVDFYEIGDLFAVVDGLNGL